MATRRSGRRPRAAEPGADGSTGGSVDPEAAARDICLRLLTARPRSRAELATVLGRKGIAAEVIDRVLDRLVEVRLVDDVAYAELVAVRPPAPLTGPTGALGGAAPAGGGR